MILGLGPEDIIGRPPSEILPHDEADRWELLLEDARHGVVEQTDLRLRRRDGTAVWVSVTMRSMHDDDGTYLGTLTTLVDNSERRRSEEALREANDTLESRVAERTRELTESEQRYRHIVQHAPTGIYEIDFRGPRFRTMNEAANALSGYSAEELLVMDPFDLLDEESRVRFQGRIQRMLGGQSVEEAVEYKVIRKDGRTIDVVLNIQPMVEDGRTIGALVVGYDITERKRIEQALRQSEAKFRGLFESNIHNVGIYEVVRDGGGEIIDLVTIDANSQLEEQLRRPMKEMVGRRISEVFGRETVSHFVAMARRVMEAGRVLQFEQYVPWNGRHYLSTYVPLSHDHLALMGLDITRRKVVEEELARHQAVLEGINRIFHETIVMGSEDLGLVCLDVVEKVTRSRFGFIGHISPQGDLDDDAISDPGWGECTIVQRHGHGSISFKAQGLYGRVMLDRKGFYTNSPASHPDSIGLPPGHPPLTSFLGVPLMLGGDLVGMFGVGNKEGGYDDDDLRTAEALAPAMAEALNRRRAEEALRESEERFRALVTSSNDVIYRMGPDWKEMRHLEGMQFIPDTTDPNEMWMEKYLHPDDRSFIQDVIDRAIRTRSIFELEHRVRRVNGSWGWTLSRAIPLLDGEGNIVEWFGTAKDVTQRRRAEAALQSAMQQTELEKQRLQTILKTSPSAIVVVDAPDGSISFMNDRAMALYGADYTGIDLSTHVAKIKASRPDGREIGVDEVPASRALHRGEEVRNEEWTIHRPDGVGIPVLASAAPIHNAQGDIASAIVMFEDITERKKAMEALRTSEERQSYLLKLSDALRSLSDPRDIISTASRVMGEHLHADRVPYAEVIDEEQVIIFRDYVKDVPSIAGRYNAADFRQFTIDAYKRGDKVIIDDVMTDPQLTATEREAFKAIHVAANASLGLRKDGRWVAAFSAHSATPRKWTELEISLLEETAERIWAALERARTEEALIESTEELRRSNEELQQFAYVASHDLQEPLRMVTNYLSLVERRHGKDLTPEVKEYLGIASRGAEQMRQLVKDLLQFSRVDTQGRKFTNLNMEHVVSMVMSDLEATARDVGASITVGTLPTVRGDELQLKQLMTNLIGNAIKFHGCEAPRIKVGAVRNGNEILFSVQDNGIGIDPRFYDKLFQMFSRLHTKDEYPGTGIGLAISKKIVERHGGRIWVESGPGKGATFYFTVPSGH